MKSFASSKLDIELEFLAKEAEIEKEKRKKMKVRAAHLAKLMEEKKQLEEYE